MIAALDLQFECPGGAVVVVQALVGLLRRVRGLEDLVNLGKMVSVCGKNMRGNNFTSLVVLMNQEALVDLSVIVMASVAPKLSFRTAGCFLNRPGRR